MWQRSNASGLGRQDGAALGAPRADGGAASEPENPAAAQRTAPVQRSTRLHLTVLVLAVLVPLLAFAGFLLWEIAQLQRIQLQKDAIEIANSLATGIDRELSNLVLVLETLAASPMIDRGDLEAVYRHAQEIKRILGSEILVKDASGQQLVNTRLPFSTPLPFSLPEGDKRAIATKRPVISDLFVGATAQRPIVSVNVPIIRDGKVVGLANAGIPPERLATILQEADLPEDWLAAVVDGQNRIVARSRRHEEFIGKPATGDLQQNATGKRGFWIGRTAEGFPVLGAYVRSTLSGWRLAVGVPVAVIEQPLYRSFAWLIGIGATALTLSALLAGFFARRLAGPMRALGFEAARLGRNEPVQPIVSRVAELSNVSVALQRASTDLQQREAERQQAEAALRGSRARLQRLLDTSPVGIVEINPQGNFIYANATAERILRAGRAELEGRRHDEMTWILKASGGETLSGRQLPGARALAGELVVGTELELFDPVDNRRVMLTVNAAPVFEDGKVQSALIAFGDITERYDAETALRRAEAELRALNETLEQRVADEIARRQQVEETLRQSQKMEAIGQLTGGVAHDFNNLLTVIMGNLENLARRLSVEDDRLRYVAAAERGATRAALLTERLLAFSRRQPLAPRVVEVNQLVAGMSDLLQRTLGEGISVDTVLADGLWQTFVDGIQLENALINLAVNARDAMPTGGRLTIETANCELDQAYAARQADVQPGQYVGVFVGDTGCGMPEDVIAKAFEPFFTTKDIGHGTGLGLSQVYGFITQSGGHVRIYSEVGRGTTVKLYLPRHAGPEQPAPEAQLPPPPRGRREETVLVVEDDPDVRAHTSEITNELGYRVLTAADGAAALDVLDRHPEVQLLLTDIGLPGGLDGRQLAELARQRRPDLRVLYTTGYARAAIINPDPGVEIILKPFKYAELALKIRRVLDA